MTEEEIIRERLAALERMRRLIEDYLRRLKPSPKQH